MLTVTRRGFLGGAAMAAVGSTAGLGRNLYAKTKATTATSSFLELLRLPDRVTAFVGDGGERTELNGTGEKWLGSGVEVHTGMSAEDLAVAVSSPRQPLLRVHLRWKQKLPSPVLASLLCMGDAWERSYGDLAWRGVVPERVMPWYFATHDGVATHGYGVKTGAAAFCFWQMDSEGVSLWLDLSNGGSGVVLGARELAAATVVVHKGQAGQPAPDSIAALCRRMCPTPRLPRGPVYGTNDWYYAYGRNSAEGILRDTELVVGLAPRGGVRPFSVIDAGWAGSGVDSDVQHPNPKFPDMTALAAEIRKRDARPGIWIRPTQAPKTAAQELLLPLSRFANAAAADLEPVYDPTIPEALAAMLDKVAQVVGWQYELVKHDYSTYDLFGQWGFQMGAQLVRPGWSFHDRSKTNAEIVLALYRALRAAAGNETLLLGCNTVGHLAAGVFEMNRTGDDTSGQHWERTRRMGVNTLAYRLPQHGTFFAMDADCVGITKTVPWEMNRQWMDLLARSGTGLFLSPSPDAIGPEQRVAIAEAFAIAAAGKSTGAAQDWLTQTTPEQWEFTSGNPGAAVTKHYSWCGEDGCEPFPA